MDVNELAEHRLRKIDAEIAALMEWDAKDHKGEANAIPTEVHRLMALRRQTEKLILAGPRGMALVA
jgi:hypothetical protein